MADEVAKLADKLRAKKGEKMAVGKEIKEAQVSSILHRILNFLVIISVFVRIILMKVSSAV